jgi:uncharacterized membrane protein
VLDHARDFYVGIGPAHDPTNLATTTLPLFFTRWVTHFCAPVFVLLSGVAAALHARKHGLGAARRFLVTRGLWLLVLELTVVRFAWIPEPFYRFILLQVIWVLGWSMVVLAALSFLPLRAILLVGLVVVMGHQLLAPLDRAHFGQLEPLWNVLHEKARVKLGSRTLFVSYPLLPWLGVAALGWCLGQLYERAAEARRRWLYWLGGACSLAFVLLRLSNFYGDPLPWSPQARGAAFTFLSFLDCEKYPPSLAFLLMTLGPALLVLAALERRPHPWLEPLALFGPVPLIFYVTHLYLLRFTAAPLAFARFGPAAFQPPPGAAGSPQYPLWAAYVALFLTVILLYPACRWFARRKSAGGSRVWSYL